jgi:hypothetical protein
MGWVDRAPARDGCAAAMVSRDDEDRQRHRCPCRPTAPPGRGPIIDHGRGFGRNVKQRIEKVMAAWAVLLLCLGSGAAWAQSAPEVLRSRFAAVREQTANNIFDRPVYLQSSEATDRMRGDVFALIDHRYDDVRQALTRADRWCGVLILHLNVKYCRASGNATPQVLDVGIGRKFDQPLPDAYWVRFDYRLVSDGADYFDITLQAPSGPLSTKDYSIRVEALPIAERRTLLHMSYGYAYGTAARWAMQVYLATIGSDKVGFSTVGKGGDGTPALVGGVRGTLERNTMRYYLAIESALGAYGLPEPQRVQKSLQDWFTATERYARQLHEMDRDAYVEMKLREVRRQQTEAAPLSGNP